MNNKPMLNNTCVGQRSHTFISGCSNKVGIELSLHLTCTVAEQLTAAQNKSTLLIV